MIEIDLVRIKKLKFLGTYILSESSEGGTLPTHRNIKGQTVHMYEDFELQPTRHFVIDEDTLRMYMRYSGISRAYSDWDQFKEKK